MKRSALARRTPLREKTRLRPVNPRRRAKLRVKDFGHRARWLMDMPCCVPGCSLHSGPPHHVKTRGAGGTKRNQVPICWEHHMEIHSLGKTSFERKYGLNLTELAVHYCGLYEYNHPRLAGRPEPDAGAAPASDPLSSPVVGIDSATAGILTGAAESLRRVG